MIEQPSKGTSILWFRGDLRLTDNPALCNALQGSNRVLPVFIFSPQEEGEWAMGSAARWWLHHSLIALDESLRRLGSRLIIRRGPSIDALRQLSLEASAERICWNRLYEPSAIVRDTEIKQGLREEGLTVESFNSALLCEPWALARGKGEPYKIFTPFWKSMQKRGVAQPVLPAPADMPSVPNDLPSLAMDELGLLPKIPWCAGFHQYWRPGEAGAQLRLAEFIDSDLAGYAVQRNRPDHAGTSRLSPHLHFGEIGPRQIVLVLQPRLASGSDQTGLDCLIRELAWREFAHHLLFHYPHAPENPLDVRFRYFPWLQPQGDQLQAWRRGMTGIPLVDAGMRELWHTGWMHNRVRMVAASFLVKNLRIHWLEGARWFWDTLLDADLANNTLGWQWVAGCGADAAPYFRIFNPVLQGQRFDPEGVYVRRWVPELARLPDCFIHQPWLAPEDLLKSCRIELGLDYPFPIVDLKTSRENALSAFRQLRESSEVMFDQSP